MWCGLPLGYYYSSSYLYTSINNSNNNSYYSYQYILLLFIPGQCLTLRVLLDCFLVLFENVHLLIGVRPVLKSCSYVIWSKTLDVIHVLWLLTWDSGSRMICWRVAKWKSHLEMIRICWDQPFCLYLYSPYTCPECNEPSEDVSGLRADLQPPRLA